MMRYFYACAWTIIFLIVAARTIAMQNPNYRCDGAIQVEAIDNALKRVGLNGTVYFVFDCGE